MTIVEMLKCGNNLLWHLNPRKKIWFLFFISFIWVCNWAPNLHSESYHHKPHSWRVLCHLWAVVRCLLPPQPGTALPVQGAEPTMPMASKAWASTAMRQCCAFGTGPQSWTQQALTALLWVSSANSKAYDWLEGLQNKAFLFISFPFPSPRAQTPQGWHFPTYIFYSVFLKSPLLHLGTTAEAARSTCRRWRGGSQAAPMAVPAWSQFGPPCWHWLRGMLMPCHLPPHLEGRSGWSCARGIQPLLAESSRLSTLSGYGTASPCSMPSTRVVIV